MMYVKKSITIGNEYCLTCILLYICTMYSTYRKIVCMYLCTYAYYLVLIRWPWRKGLSNSLSLSSPKLYCLASGLQNTIMGHCFFEVATVFFTFTISRRKKSGFLAVAQIKIQVFWGSHKDLKTSPTFILILQSISKQSGRFLSNFVAF